MSDQRTVRVATCNDQAESALIRAVLSAHGIEAIIPGDAVPHMGLGGVAFQSVVFVREDQAEEATALIAEMREGGPGALEDDADVGEDDDEDDKDDAEEQSLATTDVAVAVNRRARTVLTLMLALMLTFGTGHMSTGAWKRGVALAAVEAVGIQHLAAGHRWGIALVLGAVLADLVGALVRVQKRGAPSNLPTARVRR